VSAAAPLPKRWNWFVRGFRGYVKRYVRKHFHAVRLSKTGAALPDDGAPLLLVLNHPGWWDPMIGVVLADLFPAYTHYAAIEATMLAKYKSFNRLGFFGVDATSLRGAAEFLQTGEAILAEPKRAAWVTAQGEFADARTRPLNLRSGVGHLAARLSTGWVIPVALEYAFWTERTPESLVRLGMPLKLEAKSGTGKVWTARIEAALAETLDGLNAEAATRDPAKFSELLSGTVGVGGVYDAFRRSVALATGQRFDAGHGTTAKGTTA